MPAPRLLGVGGECSLVPAAQIVGRQHAGPIEGCVPVPLIPQKHQAIGVGLNNTGQGEGKPGGIMADMGDDRCPGGPLVGGGARDGEPPLRREGSGWSKGQTADQEGNEGMLDHSVTISREG